MLMKILTMLGNVFLNIVVQKIQMWWAKRQAEYYKKKAEVETHRLESLKEGKATEEVIKKSGDTAILNAEKHKQYADRIAELQRRAEERSKDEVA